MAAIQLHDTRDPMNAGEAIYQDLLEGRDVTADRSALAWALDAAARDLGEWWQHLAGTMIEAVAQSTDPVTGQKVLEARQDVARVTEIAYNLLALLSEHTQGIVEAQDDAFLDDDGMGMA
jgi:hypothetical protein